MEIGCGEARSGRGGDAIIDALLARVSVAFFAIKSIT
jgi:hypothetical protein